MWPPMASPTPRNALKLSISAASTSLTTKLCSFVPMTRFSTADELKQIPNYIVGTQIGTTNEITSHKLFGEANVKSYDQFPVAVQALLNKDVDAVEVDRPAAEGFILAQGGLKTLAESLNGVEGLAFAYPKGSDLIAPINAAMAAMEADGTWDDIYHTWFDSAK